jgi:hypothetical protein
MRRSSIATPIDRDAYRDSTTVRHLRDVSHRNALVPSKSGKLLLVSHHAEQR